jgi:lysyl-tRNA synthetase class 2
MQSRFTDVDFAPSASLAALEMRAALLRKLREFFYERDFIEVETPLLAPEVIPERHIDPMVAETSASCAASGSTRPAGQTTYWLQASPELHMKRLVASGAEAIFQVTRSFRAAEVGRLHNPEFTIVEWYRVGDAMQAGLDLLDELIHSLLGTPPATRTTYAEAFQRTAGLCPHTASINKLFAAADSASIAVPSEMDRGNRDEWLNLLLATQVELQLGRDRPELVYHYPATQAALAKVVPTTAGYDVAERFELYYRGIELANGFHELTDAAEQRRRFEAVNAARIADGRPALPLPESLLASLELGLPDCTGCALGFDRLAMLAIGAHSIDAVMAFPACHDTM